MPMVPLPELRARAGELFTNYGFQERERQRYRAREREILPAKKTVAALGAFFGRVRSILYLGLRVVISDFLCLSSEINGLLSGLLTKGTVSGAPCIASWLAAAGCCWLTNPQKSTQNLNLFHIAL